MIAFRAFGLLLVCYLALHNEGQQTHALPSPSTEWASRLVLEDPAGFYPGQNVVSGVPIALVDQRQKIYQMIDTKQTKLAIDHATRAIRSMALYVLKFPKNIFQQTLYMGKIKAQAVDGQYFAALHTSAKFLAHCSSSRWACPHKDMVSKLASQIEDGMRAIKEPTELLGLDREELNSEQKFTAAYRRILEPLEPRRNIWMSKSFRDYLAALHKWAKESLDSVFRQLKDATDKYRQYSEVQSEREKRKRGQQQAQDRAQPEAAPKRPRFPVRPSYYQHWQPAANSQSTPDSQQPRPSPSPQPDRPQASGGSSPAYNQPKTKSAAPEVTLDQSMIAERNAIESSRDIDEILNLSKSLINRIEANENLDRKLIAFLHELYQFKINSEIRDGKFLHALRDTAQFASMCDKQGSKCNQMGSIMRIRNELEQRFKDDDFGLFGLKLADARHMAKLRKAKMKAAILLHPDKNVNLSEEHQKYVSHLFKEATEFYDGLMENINS